MRPALALAIVLTLAACGLDRAAPPDDGTAVPDTALVPGAPRDANATAPDSLIGSVEVDDNPATIVSMTAGDRACYVTVREAGGATVEKAAAFPLCERDDLVGRRVLLTTAMANIQAESCQGDPDCTETERVRMILAADPVDEILSP
jgi:predicted small lipoprotein YifL